MSAVPFNSAWLWSYYRQRQKQRQFLRFESKRNDWSLEMSPRHSSSDEDMDWLDASLMNLESNNLNCIDNGTCKIEDEVNSDSNYSDVNSEDEREVESASDEQTDNEDKQCDETLLKVYEMKNRECIVFLNSNLNSLKNGFCLEFGNIICTCLVGSITINGFELKEAQSVKLFTGVGKRCRHLLRFSNCRSVKVGKKEIKQRFKTANINPAFIEELQESISDDETAVTMLHLKKFESFPLIVLESLNSDVRLWEKTWFRFDSFRKRVPMNAVWEEELTQSLLPQINSSSVIIVCGPKNVGKSSVLRWLVNRVLSSDHKEVYFVDCDPGQCEFTAPGLLSFAAVDQPILMPPFISVQMFKNHTFYSTSVGGTNVSDNPDLYLMNFKQLWEQALNFLDFAGRKPIFINTMGWMKDIGLQLLIDIINFVRPTDLIELTFERGEKKRAYKELTPANVRQMNCWSIGCPTLDENEIELNYNYVKLELLKGREPKSSRDAVMNRVNAQLAYLSLCEEIRFKEFSDLQAHQYKLSEVFIHVVYECPVDKLLSVEIIKNSWVHLCRVCDEIPKDNEDIHILSELNENMCLGSGIVRNLNVDEGYIEVLSCESTEKLDLVNCIIKPMGIFVPEQLIGNK
ncbi:polynucleotide 5'-hydroxyl-kinase NOL9-like protein [Leptotrombidium deliense]|uniref:Polynucleotide 5'-hydroxyl-kinase NOL9 n=1 Tax=Leptotrombidium deliense TaxID=299467 RepID=A0A443SBA2_9ACAR|nr:polynucleotide 5'-hydroxyl-kinase NOL9-like protein [Leptotrombidium deliense]